MPTDIEERLRALEQQNRTLQDEITALRRAAEPPAPRPPKEVPGQGPRPFGDATGSMYCGEPSAPGGSSAGSGGFGSAWRKQPDGSKRWMPDNLPRDPVSGEITWQAAKPLPDSALPRRSVQHEHAVELIDAMLPIVPPRLDPEG